MAVVLTARYSALQSTYWGTVCLIVNFASIYLLAHGLSNAEIGVMMAVASAVATVVQPILAGVVDRSKVPLRLWLAMGGVAFIVLAAALFPLSGGFLVAVLYGLLVALTLVLQPIVNSVGMAALALGYRVNFGVARASGSLAFALLSLGVGALVAATSEKSLLLMLIVASALFILAAVTFVLRSPAAPADGGAVPGAGADDAVGSGSDGVAVAPLTEPAALTRRAWVLFVLLLIGVTLGITGHMVINTFLFQITGFHGGDAAAMGLVLMIAAMSELPTMVAFTRLVARWSPGTLLVVAGIGFAVKNVVTYLAPNLTALYLSQLLQMVAFGLAIPASVYYVNRLFPSTLRVRGQSYMTMTFSAGNVLGALMGGVVLDAAGVPMLLLVASVVATAGAVLVWLGADRS